MHQKSDWCKQMPCLMSLKTSSNKSVNKKISTEEISCPHKPIKITPKVTENKSDDSKLKYLLKIIKIENVPELAIITPCSLTLSQNENESLQDSTPTRITDESDDSDHMAVLFLPLDDSQNDRANDALHGEGPRYQILSEVLTDAVTR